MSESENIKLELVWYISDIFTEHRVEADFSYSFVFHFLVLNQYFNSDEANITNICSSFIILFSFQTNMWQNVP